MNLTLRDGVLYVDNLKFCLAEAGNGRPNLPTGRFEVATQFSHAHRAVLPDANGLGWLGAMPGCDVVLGSVRGRDGVIPSPSVVGRLVAVLEIAEGRGAPIWLEVVN